MTHHFRFLGLLVPAAMAFACSSSSSGSSSGGTGGADASSATGGGANGTGGSAAGTGGSAAGTGGAAAGTGGAAAGTGGAATGAGGGAVTGCDTAACTGKMAFGQSLSACCVSATECGVTAPAAGMTCIPLSVINQFSDGGVFGKTEKIVTDPACKDRTFSGGGGAGGGGDAGSTTLTGCCDPSGVCGFSTESFAAQTGGALGIQCLTPADIASFGQGFGQGSVDAGAPVPCTYPTGG